MPNPSSRSIAYPTLFAVAGALLGYAHYYVLEYALADLSHGAGYLEVLLAIVAVPCVVSVAALPSWGFRAGNSYWRAPLLCAIALTSWLIIHVYLLNFISVDRESVWEILELGTQGAVEVFAMFAYIIRAMAARSGVRAVSVFIILGAATNLISLLLGTTWLTSVCRYCLLMGMAAFAAYRLPIRVTPQIKTLVVEAR
jgi:hypothetical protein